MSVPDLVREHLGKEDVRATVSLGEEDEVVVTPTRTLLYRGEGLIRDATVQEYPHDAESVSVSESRRKTTIQLDHGIDGESEFAVPTSHVAEVLPLVLEGVLRVNGVLAADEGIEEVYHLGELTIVITEGRVLKHVGNALWDEDAEEYAFGGVTSLDFEKGEVSSQIIVESNGRPQRIKVPSEESREIRERIERALLAYHDASTYREFERRQHANDDAADAADPDEPDATEEEESGVGGIEFENLGSAGGDADPTPLEGDASATDSTAEIAEEVAALREAVERQNERLEAQQRTIEQLIEELREI